MWFIFRSDFPLGFSANLYGTPRQSQNFRGVKGPYVRNTRAANFRFTLSFLVDCDSGSLIYPSLSFSISVTAFFVFIFHRLTISIVCTIFTLHTPFIVHFLVVRCRFFFCSVFLLISLSLPLSFLLWLLLVVAGVATCFPSVSIYLVFVVAAIWIIFTVQTYRPPLCSFLNEKVFVPSFHLSTHTSDFWCRFHFRSPFNTNWLFCLSSVVVVDGVGVGVSSYSVCFPPRFPLFVWILHTRSIVRTRQPTIPSGIWMENRKENEMQRPEYENQFESKARKTDPIICSSAGALLNAYGNCFHPYTHTHTRWVARLFRF